jgi:rhombotail lipoprotein
MNNKILITIVAIFAFSLISCGNQQTRSKSSVVDYLYPTDTNTAIQPSIPTLNLPLKVGIAFVPEQGTETRGRNQWSGVVGSGAALTSATKTDLLDKVASNFKQLGFVSEIEVIPTEYLTHGGSFNNLEQIQTMYGIDIIALVSYDQVQFTDEGFLSLTYWTIVGAYVVSGEINDTSTMLDTVVYDIKSKKMLFRAPGTSVVKGNATPVNLSEELRADSIKGFNTAAEEMTKNLHSQLARFKEKIKQSPEQVKIVHREGYSGSSGGGAFNLYTLVILLLIAVTKKNLTNSSSGRKKHAA